MTEVLISPSTSEEHYPGLDYSQWPDHPYDLACALSATDDGNITSVASFLQPYVTKDVTPEGWLKVPRDPFNTPLRLARWHVAYDSKAPIPWRGTGCTPIAIKEYFEDLWAEKVKEQEALVSSQGYLYFVGADEGPIKIGMTSNPKKRIKGLQTGHPHKLRYLALVPNASLQEAVYHERFAKHRLEGEWFTRHPDILAEIARLTPPAQVVGREG